jgi:hypothetical protein
VSGAVVGAGAAAAVSGAYAVAVLWCAVPKARARRRADREWASLLERACEPAEPDDR